MVLKKNDSNNLFNILKYITQNKNIRRSKQHIFYKNNNFNLKKISSKLDYLRDLAFDVLPKKDVKRLQKRVLHVANFNENADGRLYYSFANKLNNGFIKNNYIVQNISDRYFLKSNRSLLQPFNTVNKFNEKILNTLKNFSPHLLLIGHVFNINETVYDYCKNNNIKIVSWFIDSISKEFLNGKKECLFLKILNMLIFVFNLFT